MLTALLPFPGGPDAVPGVYQSAPTVRSRNGSSVYDEARVTLDRLIAGGAFTVSDYDSVRDAIVGQAVTARTFVAVRDALVERLGTATFRVEVDADPETDDRQIVVVAQTNMSPEAAADAAWAFYRDWLGRRPLVRAVIAVSIRPC